MGIMVMGLSKAQGDAGELGLCDGGDPDVYSDDSVYGDCNTGR